MKHIAFLDVGGTISSYSSQPAAEFYYQRGDSILTLVNEFIDINKIKIQYEFFSNKISHELTPEELLDLARKIQIIVNKPEIHSLVVSIGTNALEDIAYFIDLIVSTNKNIVFTGAHYPQNHLIFDGKKNLFNALIVAQLETDQGNGVVVTLNDAVVSAKWATKGRAGLMHDFSSQGMGVLGYISGDVFHQVMRPNPKSENFNQFSIETMKSFPKIGVVYAHFGIDIGFVEYLVNSDVDGIVSAGYGKGYQTKEISDLLKYFVDRKDGPVVRCSRSGFANSNRDARYDDKYGFILASQLTPQKASVLLAVCLAHKLTNQEIKQIFEEN